MRWRPNALILVSELEYCNNKRNSLAILIQSISCPLFARWQSKLRAEIGPGGAVAPNPLRQESPIGLTFLFLPFCQCCARALTTSTSWCRQKHV